MPMSPIVISDLSVHLLESDPQTYLDALNYLADEETSCTKEELKAKLNETPYETWHSNHAFSLCRLVGKMNPEVVALTPEKYSEGSYYGSITHEGIDETLAKTILDKIVECGGNILDTDYYDNHVVEEMGNEARRFYRTDNKQFIEYVRGVFERAESQ